MAGKSDYKNLEKTMSLIQKNTSTLGKLQSELKSLEEDLVQLKNSATNPQPFSEINYNSLTLSEISQLLGDLDLPKSGKKSAKIDRLKKYNFNPNHLTASSLRILLKALNLRRSGPKSELRARLNLCFNADFEDIDSRISTLEERLVQIDDKYGVYPDKVKQITEATDELSARMESYRQKEFNGKSPSKFKEDYIHNQSVSLGAYYSRSNTFRGKIFSILLIFALPMTLMFFFEVSPKYLSKNAMFTIWGMLVVAKFFESRPEYQYREIEKKRKIQLKIKISYEKEFGEIAKEYYLLKEEYKQYEEKLPSEKSINKHAHQKKELERTIEHLTQERDSIQRRSNSYNKKVAALEKKTQAKKSEIDTIRATIESCWNSVKEFVPYATQIMS